MNQMFLYQHFNNRPGKPPYHAEFNLAAGARGGVRFIYLIKRHYTCCCLFDAYIKLIYRQLLE